MTIVEGIKNLSFESLNNKQEFLLCARYGELEDLQRMLSETDELLKYKDPNGNTALHMASANGHLGIILVIF